MNNRVKLLRKQLHLTQAEFASKINVKQNSITGYEKGTTTIPDRTIIDICREYHVDETWLRTGEGSMFQEPSALDIELNARVAELLADQNADEWIKRMLLEFLRLPPDSQRACRDFLKRTLLEEEDK